MFHAYRTLAATAIAAALSWSAAGAQTIQVTNPRGGETFRSGDTVLVQWTADAAVNVVDVRLTTDGGDNWQTLSPTGAVSREMPQWGNLLWIVNEQISSSQCRIRVNEYQSPAIAGESGVFSITGGTPPPVIPFTLSPTAVVCHGDTVFDVQIVPTDTIPRIAVTESAPWLTTSLAGRTITNTVSVSGLASGTHTATVTVGDSGIGFRSYTVTLQLGSDTGGIVVTSPRGGETFRVPDTVLVEWTAGPEVSSVVIMLTTDNGETWQVLTAQTIQRASPQWGGFLWIVNDTVASSQCRIKVADYARPDLCGLSGTFSLDGGQGWPLMALGCGSYVYVHGDTVFSIAVSNGGGGTLPDISAGDTTSWLTVTVDNSPENAATVRNTVNTDGLAEGYYSAQVWLSAPGVPDATYTVRLTVGNPPAVVVHSPRAGDTVRVDDTVLVSWSCDPAVAQVVLDVSADSGSTWQRVESRSYPAARGSYVWLVSAALTGLPSSKSLLRVADYSSPGARYGVSGAFVLLSRPVISLVPGALTMGSRDTAMVSVSNAGAGALSALRAEPSQSWLSARVDSLSPVSARVTNTVDTTGLAPGVYSAQVRVTASGAAAKSYTVTLTVGTPTLVTVTQPRAGDTCRTGDTVLVRWSVADSQLCATGMVLAYSVDDGESYRLITQAQSVFGTSYPWVVPHSISGLPSSQCRIRVHSYMSGDIAGVSGRFSIGYGDTSGANPPQLYLSRQNVAVSSDTSFVVTAANTGGGVLPVLQTSLKNPAPWLSVTVDNSPANGALIRNTVSVAGLSDGVHSTVVIVSGAGIQSCQYGVTLTVGAPVTPVATAIRIIPLNPSCAPDDSIAFSAEVVDQNGAAMRGYTFRWAVSAGCGTISPSGLFVSNGVSGSFQVAASIENPPLSATSAVHVMPYPLTLVSPKGGEVWQAGQRAVVEWTADSSVSDVSVLLSVDGGLSWHTISGGPVSRTDGAWGAFVWTVPEMLGGASTVSNACLALVRSGDGGRTSRSAAPFAIVPPVLRAVDTTGGTVSLAGVAVVEIPAGARKAEDAAEPIAIVQTRTTVAPPEGFQLEGSGDVFLFLPHGTEFDSAVIISIPYTGAREDVRILRRSDDSASEWEVIAGIWFDDQNAPGMVFFRTTVFSVYAVSYRAEMIPAEPATSVQPATLTAAVRTFRLARVPGALIIEIPEHGAHQVAVHALDGRVVARITGEGAARYTIPSRAWSAGAYVVRVRYGGEVVSRTVVVGR